MVKIKPSSVFGKAVLPDGNTITFGDYNYTDSGEYDKDEFIEIEASVVFGSMEIKNVHK